MMSETQKVFTSLSGAVIAHILLMVLVFFMLATKSNPSAYSAGQQPEPRPREVTILMSELMKQVEVEPPEPEPEPELPPEPRPRNFFATDTNAPEAEAPENATFISDRNTSAATEIMPNPDLPQEQGPTTEGSAPIPFLRLQDRDYVDGELDRPPATQPQPQPQSAAEARVGNAAAESEGVRSGVEGGTGELQEAIEGADLPPENPVAEQMTRPPLSEDQGQEEESLLQKSFSDPNSTLAGLPDRDEGEEDRFAEAIPETEEAEEGEMADLREKEEQRSGIEGGEGTKEIGSAKKDAEAGQMARPGDVGLFADGFSAFQRKRTVNGTISNLGQNAVDAEETPEGKYEAEVNMAVSRQWHLYRVENMDFAFQGLLRVTGRIDKNGGVHDLKVIENKANAVFTDFSLRAILDAKIPAMPKEVADDYGVSGYNMDFQFIIY